MNDLLIVGLGNPDKKYELTRHNAGFLVVDALAKELRAAPFKLNKRHHALIAQAQLPDSRFQIPDFLTLAKPQTFMNLTGQSVAALVKKSRNQEIKKSFLIVSDDLDLSLGTIRLREQGGAGGHNGLKSIIEHLGTEEFPRLRIGIRPPRLERQPGKAEDFVLQKFTSTELQQMREEIIPNAVKTIINHLKPLTVSSPT